MFHRPAEGGLAAVGSVDEQHPIERGDTILPAQAVHVASLLAGLGLLGGGAVLVDGDFAGTVGGILADDNGISLGDEVGFQIPEHALEVLTAFVGPGHVVDVQPVPGIIGVNLDGDVALVAARVGGDGKTVHHGNAVGGSIGRNNQVPVGVVATSGAHCLDKLGGMLVHVLQIG